MKNLLFIIITLLGLILFVSTADAAQTNGCQPLYGGGETCKQSTQISINKKVLNPAVSVTPNQKFANEDYIENVNSTGRVYGPNQPIAFRLEVTNISNKTLNDITVIDYIPVQHVTFMSGEGTYNRQTQTFTAEIDSLKSNEKRVITLQLMSARIEDLERNNNSLCTLNRSEIRTGKEISQDNAIVCVQGNTQPTAQTNGNAQQNTSRPSPTQTKGGTPVYPQNNLNTRKTPDTGPELFALAGLLPIGLAGFYIRKKSLQI